MEITVGNILTLRQELLQAWNVSHGKWHDWEQVIRQQHQVARMRIVPKRYMGLAASKVFGMADTLITDNPTVTRVPRGVKREKKVQYDRSETWGRGVLRTCAIESGSVAPFRAGATNISGFGYANGVIRWNDQWPRKPKKNEKGYKTRMERWEKRQKEFPFIIEFPHPARILIPHNERIPSMAIETAGMYGWQVKERFPRYAEFVTQEAAFIEVIYYTDENRRATVIGNQVVEDLPNIYGFVNYVHGFAGWGIEQAPVYGSPESPQFSFGATPENLAQGLLANSMDVIKLLDQWFSAIGFEIVTIPGRLFITAGDAYDFNQQLEDAGGMGVIQGDPDRTREFPKAKLEPWMFEVGRMLKDALDSTTYSAVVQGERQPGVATATEHALMLGSARQRFGHPMQELNYMAGQLLGMAAKMVSIRDEPIEIDGVVGSKGLFDGNYRFYVDFLAEDEGARMRQKTSNQWEIQQGGLDWETHHEEVGRGNGPEILRRVNVQKFTNLPLVQESILMAALEHFRQLRLKEGVMLPPLNTPLPMPGPDGGGGQAPGAPQGFVQQPGGPTEQRNVVRGMAQVPGQGMERAGMTP